MTGNADVAGKLSVTGNADLSGNVGIGMKLTVTGNAEFTGVGIGTNSLGTSKFKVANSASDFAHFRFGDAGAGEFEFVGWGNGWNINSKTSGKNLYLNRDANANSDALIGRSTREMIIKGDTGNVGIGTTSPTKAKLEISGSASYDLGRYGYLNASGTTGTYTAGRLPYSLWASNAVAAPEFQTYSDARIKNIQGRSDSATDLRTLLGIEVTNYRYKDVIGNGNGTYKKVTGQQVEKVFPQAVSKQTQVVPDIYRQASIEDGWIALTTDLKKGERVQLISEKATGVYEVLEVGQGRFRTDLKPTENRIFVYGREVKDFLSVDYGAISMLNVSATQQIKKEKDEEVKALQEENAALRSQLAGQFSQLAAQEQRLTELEAKDKAREERLAALEALLLAGVNQAPARRH